MRVQTPITEFKNRKTDNDTGDDILDDTLSPQQIYVLAATRQHMRIRFYYLLTDGDGAINAGPHTFLHPGQADLPGDASKDTGI